ncbi:MAG: hypothetical protein KBC44_02480 [Candidatus Pacebacteria bacterium]|nr:hypothetical protein [Candidatus Paceibacterota bacterium]MBP9839824.1 hypothetical protein [Candidatus Paceibacterota bacterium]
MSSFLSLHYNKDSTHHAYLIEGSHEEVWSDLKSVLEEMGIKTEGNPDFSFLVFDTFKIDDARNIKSFSSEKSFASNEGPKRSKKVLVVSANNFLQEAQNTLLKMFEEPNQDSHFFLITPDKNLLLKTLQSRFYSISYPRGSSDYTKEVEDFIKMNIRERLDFIKDNFVSKDDEEGELSSRTRASLFLNSLEEVLSDKVLKKENKNYKTEPFEQIFTAREYLRQNGTSPKSLLEGVALSMPEF